MLPAGVLIAIRADFWQSLKNERKAESIEQVLTSACSTWQKVASNHVTAILERSQKSQNFVVLLLLRHTFYFHAISQELLICRLVCGLVEV